MIFRPLAQGGSPFATLRGSCVALAFWAGPGATGANNPDVALYDVRPMSVHLDNGSAFFIFRVGAFITGVFGGMGLLLRRSVLYGVIAYTR